MGAAHPQSPGSERLPRLAPTWWGLKGSVGGGGSKQEGSC